MAIFELTTGWYYGKLVDQEGTMLASANIEDLHVTLYNEATEIEIDSFDAYISGVNQNNGITIDDTRPVYNLIYVIPADKNTVSSTLSKEGCETHIILFEGCTSGNPSFDFKHVASIQIKNVVKVGDS